MSNAVTNPKSVLTAILDRKETRIAYFPSGREFSVAGLRADAQKFCELTKDVGRIFIAAPNGYEWLVVYFACIMSDKVLFSADFQLNTEELNRRIAICAPDVILTAGDKALDRKVINIKDILTARYDRFERKAGSESGLPADGEYAFIQFTSGTTGNSKGVIMRYEQIAANMVGMQELCKFLPEDHFLLASAMSHPMGHIFMLLTLAYGGRLTIVESSVFLPQAALNSRATIMVAPPVMLNGFKAFPEMVQKLKSFRYLLCAGAPLDQTAYDFYRTQGIWILNGYGMTECVSGVAMSAPDSTGRLIPLSNCEIKLADDGEVLVRGACVCERYIGGNPIVSGGWYHTNDLGRFDQESGKLLVTGRKDHLIVLQNGYKIALEPMEEKINRTPGVLDCAARVVRSGAKDVIECDVVPAKDYAFVSDAELKRQINENLDFYEKLDKVNICEKLELKGGKKKRG